MSTPNTPHTNAASPYAAGFRFPAEWSPHRTCYTAWPAHAYAWGPALHAAQQEFVAFVRAFTADVGQEPLTLFVSPEALPDAQRQLGQLDQGQAALESGRVQLRAFEYGDVWLRDTAPLFLLGPTGLACSRFRFNGWGEKYIYPHDAELSARLAELREVPTFSFDWVLEGGAIDVDGAGTCLTTRSCLQNPNRGPIAQDADIAARLRESLGIEHVIWLDAGLANDHTDGHVDNIARFIAKGVVVCMQAQDADDPNHGALDHIAATLAAARTAQGDALRVVRVPSPGRVLNTEGEVMPASYMNFYIGNRSVIVPGFGTRWDEPARAALQELFPQHHVVMTSARAILEGGGTFHCMTQQEPLTR